MSQNSGTLVTAAIRPNDSLDPIASAFANEIKGGKHSYATLVERDALIVERRDWGMECDVFNDPSPANNGIYRLTYNFHSTTLTDNLNWEEIGAVNPASGMNIGDENLTALVTVNDGDLATNSAISETPIISSKVIISVNGVNYELGNGIKTKDCYFSADGGTTAKSYTDGNNRIETGDLLYWNGSIAGFNLDGGDRISFIYLI